MKEVEYEEGVGAIVFDLSGYEETALSELLVRLHPPFKLFPKASNDPCP